MKTTGTWVLLFALTTPLGGCAGKALDIGSNDEATGGWIGIGSAAGASSAGAPESEGGAGGTVGSPKPADCPCSRRPGINNSFQCVQGLGETTSAVIGPDGGVLTLKGEQGHESGVSFEVRIPRNVVGEDSRLLLTETASPPPAELVDYSPVYLLEPPMLTSSSPMRLTVPFGNGDGSYVGLSIYTAPTVDGPFEPLSDSRMNAGFMEGSTRSFGAFVVAGPRSPERAGCP